MSPIPYTQELQRKLIHLSSLWMVILYAFVSWPVMLAIILVATIGVVASDILRHRNPHIQKLFALLFSKILRQHEVSPAKGISLTGASYMMLSASLCVLIFPQTIFMVAFTILIISDSAAALIGRRWGKRPFLGKSVEGTAAFIISALAIICFFGQLWQQPLNFYLVGILAAILGGLAEVLAGKFRLDDNFVIPLSVGLVMVLLG